MLVVMKAVPRAGELARLRSSLAEWTTAWRQVLLASPLGITALGYLAAIATAEFVTALVDLRLGMAIHGIVLTLLLLHGSLVDAEPDRRLFLALSLAPMIRILSLSLPLEDIDLVYWYIIVAVPLLAGSLLVARMLRLGRRDLGLALAPMRIQLLVASTGFVFGILEYFILKPEPLIDSFSFQAVLLPALILLVGTGLLEELAFRGVMQSAARDALGKAAILYVSALFAVLHIGFLSVIDVAFVFVVGLFFAWVVLRTGSILGVTLSHGITNIALLLVIPFLL